MPRFRDPRCEIPRFDIPRSGVSAREAKPEIRDSEIRGAIGDRGAAIGIRRSDWLLANGDRRSSFVARRRSDLAPQRQNRVIHTRNLLFLVVRDFRCPREPILDSVIVWVVVRIAGHNEKPRDSHEKSANSRCAGILLSPGADFR